MAQPTQKIQQLKIGQQVICTFFGGEVCTVEKCGNLYWKGRVFNKEDDYIDFDLYTGKIHSDDIMPAVFPANDDFAQAVNLLTNAYEATA